MFDCVRRAYDVSFDSTSGTDAIGGGHANPITRMKEQDAARIARTQRCAGHFSLVERNLMEGARLPLAALISVRLGWIRLGCISLGRI